MTTMEDKITLLAPYISASLSGKDQDIAIVLYQFYKETIKCVSCIDCIWYEKTEDGWKEIEGCSPIRQKLQTDIYMMYKYCYDTMLQSLVSEEMEDATDRDKCQEETKLLMNVMDILQSLKRRGKIVKIAKRLFYDPSFVCPLIKPNSYFS
jgi:hypothetical protein